MNLSVLMCTTFIGALDSLRAGYMRSAGMTGFNAFEEAVANRQIHLCFYINESPLSYIIESAAVSLVVVVLLLLLLLQI